MKPDTIRAVLTDAKDAGHRVAVGFAHRSFFIENVARVEAGPNAGADTTFTVTGLVYDTGHSRQATPETIYFEAGDVVSLARPAVEE